MSSNDEKIKQAAVEKQRNAFLFRALVIVCVFYCIYYAWHTYKVKSTPKYSSSYSFGVVQTSEDSNISYITYYDKNMKKGYTQKIKHGSIGDTLETPQIVDAKTLYMISNGKKSSKTDDKMVSINIKAGTQKVYPVAQTDIKNFRVDAKNIYTAAEKDGNLNLVKYVKGSKETASLSYKGYSLDCFKVSKKKLYAFLTSNTDKNAEKGVLKIIDGESMTEEASVDVSAFPGHKTDLVLADTELYFSYKPVNATAKQKGGIGIYNLVSKKLEHVTTTIATPDGIFLSEGKVVATSKAEKKVTVIDYLNNTSNTYDLPTTPTVAKVTATYFYYMDDTKIHRYKLADFSQVNEVKVPLKAVSKDSKKKCHLTSFFVK